MHSDPPKSSRRVVATRYALLELLGRGANGTVWRAHDRVTRKVVALKRLDVLAAVDRARFRREIAALRTLTIPGVVRLLDDGLDEGCPYLVTELIEGGPFPGTTPPATWQHIESAVASLLDTVQRIHNAGYVHRDIKPANILVSAADGRATVLDFGLSRVSLSAERLTQHGHVVGTIAYCAPEQMDGSTPGSVGADLFSIGLMLYEALSANLPEGDPGSNGFLVRRLTERAPPLLSVAPGVPPHVARVIDALLEKSPEQRPHSAAEALAALRGQAFQPSTPIRYIGDKSVIDALVEAGRSGASLGIVANVGFGKSRCLQEGITRLKQAGTNVIELTASARPLSSLAAALSPLNELDASTIEQASAVVEERLRALLQKGTVLIADDFDSFDAASKQVLCRLQPSGGLLWSSRISQQLAAGPELRLLVRTRSELAGLFAGIDRVLHLREDASKLLHERSAGVPRRILAELAAWQSAQLIGNEQGTYRIDRAALDKISQSLEYGAQGREPWPTQAQQPHLVDVARWLWLSWPNSRIAVVAKARREPMWRVAADVDQLIVGAAASRHNDRIDVRPGFIELPAWPASQRRQAHQRLAESLPIGAPGRLRHMIRANDTQTPCFGPELLAAEALAAADCLTRAGELTQALAILEDASLAVQATAETSDADIELGVVPQALVVAIDLAAPDALDRILYSLMRRADSSPAAAQLHQLAHAAAETLKHDGRAALRAVEAVGEMADVRLELCRRHLLSLAARRCPIDVHRRVVADLEQWAARTPAARAASYVPSWCARLRYHTADYAEAARLHFLAASRSDTLTARIEDTLHGAAALLETFELDAAMQHARAAGDLARQCRHAYEEAWAEWVYRTAQYRAAEDLPPDLELLAAARSLGAPELTAVIAGTEAAFAYRQGHRPLTRRLATEAYETWMAIGKTWPALLLRALALHAGAAPADSNEMPQLVREALNCTVAELGLQALALLPDLKLAPADRAAFAVRLAELPATDCRMDLLSPAEVRASATATAF